MESIQTERLQGLSTCLFMTIGILDGQDILIMCTKQLLGFLVVSLSITVETNVK